MHTHWGNETTAYGTSKFEAKLGIGGDINITRITGHVSAAPQTDKISAPSIWSTDKVRMRQALVVFVNFGRHEPSSTKTITAADRTNNEVDGHFGMVNPKVFGNSQVIIPFDFHFDPPVLAPSGRIGLQIDNEGPGALSYDKDTLNVEVHQTIQWKPG